MYSGQPNSPQLIVYNPYWVDILKRRLLFYARNTRIEPVLSCSGILGYRGCSVGLVSPTSPSYPTFSLCNEGITYFRSPADSRLWQFADPRRELEWISLQAALHASGTSTALSPQALLSGVPIELCTPVNTFGVLELELGNNDSFAIDFSLLDSLSVMRSRSRTSNPLYGRIPDLFLVPLPFISSTKFGTTLDARYDSLAPLPADLWPFFEGDMQLAKVGTDSLKHRYFDPIKLPEGQVSVDEGFLIPSSEGGRVFWRPFAEYIGGINRLYIFWAYSQDGRFGSTALVTKLANRRNLAGRSTSQPGTTQVSFFDLQGRFLVTHGKGNLRSAARSPVGCRIVQWGQGAFTKRIVAGF